MINIRDAYMIRQSRKIESVYQVSVASDGETRALQLLSVALPEEARVMPQTGALDYMSALRYVAAWAAFVNVSTTELIRNPHEFHGTLGSLDFAYSDDDHQLHVFSFITPGAGPLLTNRVEMKATIDQIAREHPEETDGGTFDVRTLSWNERAGIELEPCLWLRLDVGDSSIPVSEMVKKLDHFSTVGFNWNRHKMLDVQRAYWKAHPKTSK